MTKPSFDFSQQAKALIKRLGQNPGASPSVSMNQGLALAAVEAALREAYAKGQEDAIARPGSRAPVKSPVSTPIAVTPRECPHEWEDVFIDGKSLGGKCIDCGVLQHEVQERCDHYFVKVGSGEMCVACRKTRRVKA